MTNRLDDQVLAELREIRFHLSLLTHDIRSKAFTAFDEQVLKTEARKLMFHALNDERNAMQLADVAGVSRQAALNLLHDLELGGFITIRAVGQAQVGKQNIDGVLNWYYAHPSGQNERG